MNAVLDDFKKFLMQGSLITLAVAFVIGGAFAGVVTALVNDLIMPVIAAVFGKSNFGDLTFSINNSVFLYGSFITAVIAFVSIAAAVFFFVVKPYEAITARATKPEVEVESDEERRHRELLEALKTRA